LKTRGNYSQKLTRKSKLAQNLYRGLNRLPFLTRSQKYCVTISDTQKFVWYRVAKVGTRTIFNALKQTKAVLSVKHAHDVCIPTGHFDDYFKFAFVRNPFDRLVSCWLNKVRGRKMPRFGVNKKAWEEMQEFAGFISFIEGLDLTTCDEHLRLQSSMIDLSAVDYIGRMESFSADAAEVFEIIGVEVPSLESRNVTKSRVGYKEYYSAKDVERVHELYKKDCQIFGYSF